MLDSLLGSKHTSFIIVRGVSDYVDGLVEREWQSYAALAAASFAKAIIEHLPPSELQKPPPPKKGVKIPK